MLGNDERVLLERCGFLVDLSRKICGNDFGGSESKTPHPPHDERQAHKTTGRIIRQRGRESLHPGDGGYRVSVRKRLGRIDRDWSDDTADESNGPCVRRWRTSNGGDGTTCRVGDGGNLAGLH